MPSGLEYHPCILLHASIAFNYYCFGNGYGKFRTPTNRLSTVPKFRAKLTMLFGKVDFLGRFANAAAAGYKAVDDTGYQGWLGCEYKPAGKSEDGLGWITPGQR